MAEFTLPNGHNYFVDSAGRILIFSCGIDGAELTDPRTLTKTTGKVLPSSNTCIDDARWQYIRNTLAPSSDNWRLTVATTDSTNCLYGNSSTNERSILLTASARNINTFKSYNVRALPSSLTDWLYRPDFSGGGSVTFMWDEDSGSDGVGLDYSGIIFQSAEATPASYYRGFGVYSQSSRPGFGAGQYSYFHRNLEFWILPPGVPDFPAEEGYKYQLDGNGLSHNPGDTASNHQYGWFTRSGAINSNPVSNGTKPFQGDCRQLVLVWNGVVIFDSIDSPIIVAPASGSSENFVSWAGAGTSIVGRNDYTYPININCGVVVGNYVYYPGSFQGSEYGWPNSGIGYSAPSPLGDLCNGFQIKRRRYFPSIPFYTGNKTNGQTSEIPKDAKNIFFDVNGGRGGRGGDGYGNPGATNYTHPGGYYAHGQRICGYIKPHTDILNCTHYVGGNGGNGSAYFRAMGGAGGVAYGGAGLNGAVSAGDYYGGGGGGGGAASGLYVNTYANYACISGGGGSGGGSGGDAKVVPNLTIASTGSISPGGNSTWLSTASTANNGGGGGGGGGAPGGAGGSGSPSGNTIPGNPGIGGSGFADLDAIDYAYIVPDWLVGTTTYLGMQSSRNSNWNPSGRSELYFYLLGAETYAAEVGVRLKLYDNGTWVPAKEMYVKTSYVVNEDETITTYDPPEWKLVQDCYIKQNGEWRPFYG